MQGRNYTTGWVVGGSLMALGLLLLGGTSGVVAQGIPRTGQDIAPAFEGWRNNPDGSYDLMFGYFNRNLEQELDIPVGPDNLIEPGGPDQGQPTHFYPRRNRFVFRIRVPKEFADTTKELVWTLVSNGKKNTTYATLHPDYYTDDIVIMNNNGAGGSGGGGYDINSNTAPVLKVEGARTRTVAVGQPVDLAAMVTDDGIPKRRVVPLLLPWTEQEGRRARIGTRCCNDSASGLRLNWYVYRGPAAHVTFDPPQFSHWEDYRDGRNSPFSAGWEPPAVPPDHRWTARATFSQPGTYVLRTLAHDGGLSATDDLTIVVK